MLDTPTLTPGSRRPKRGAQWDSGALAIHFGENFKTKVAGHPQLSGYGLPVWTPNQDLEGPGPGVLMEPWSFTFKGIL